MFKINEGTVDRGVRVLAGLILLSLIFIYPDAGWKWWGLVGLIPLVTGLVGWCPLYSVFGMSTCPAKKD